MFTFQSWTTLSASHSRSLWVNLLMSVASWNIGYIYDDGDVAVAKTVEFVPSKFSLCLIQPCTHLYCWSITCRFRNYKFCRYGTGRAAGHCNRFEINSALGAILKLALTAAYVFSCGYQGCPAVKYVSLLRMCVELLRISVCMRSFFNSPLRERRFYHLFSFRHYYFACYKSRVQHTERHLKIIMIDS